MRGGSSGRRPRPTSRVPASARRGVAGRCRGCLWRKGLSVPDRPDVASAYVHEPLRAVRTPAATLIAAHSPPVLRNHPQRRGPQTLVSHRALPRGHQRRTDTQAACVVVDHDGPQLARRLRVVIAVARGTHRHKADHALATLGYEEGVATARRADGTRPRTLTLGALLTGWAVAAEQTGEEIMETTGVAKMNRTLIFGSCRTDCGFSLTWSHARSVRRTADPTGCGGRLRG